MLSSGTARRADRPSSSASHQRASGFVVKGVSAREFVIPLVAATLVLLMAFRSAGQLPDPVASAWDLADSPVDRRNRLIELVTGVAVTVASAVVPLLLAVRVRQPVGQRLLVVAAQVLPVLFVGHRWRLVAATRGRPLRVWSYGARGDLRGGGLRAGHLRVYGGLQPWGEAQQEGPRWQPRRGASSSG